MIVLKDVQSLNQLLAWFNFNEFFPEPKILDIDSSTGAKDDRWIQVNFGDLFTITFYGGVLRLEDLCRCDLSRESMLTVRHTIAALLSDEETYRIAQFGAPPYSHIIAQQANAFAIVFGRRHR